MTTFIVSRHSGAIKWLRLKGFQGKVITHLNPATIKAGDVVVGVLPITLVKKLIDKGITVYSLQLPDVPKELRGQELTPEMMDEFGAKVYKITSLEWEEVKQCIKDFQQY